MRENPFREVSLMVNSALQTDVWDKGTLYERVTVVCCDEPVLVFLKVGKRTPLFYLPLAILPDLLFRYENKSIDSSNSAP